LSELDLVEDLLFIENGDLLVVCSDDQECGVVGDSFKEVQAGDIITSDVPVDFFSRLVEGEDAALPASNYCVFSDLLSCVAENY
jgi:hypothetical protein